MLLFLSSFTDSLRVPTQLKVCPQTLVPWQCRRHFVLVLKIPDALDTHGGFYMHVSGIDTARNCVSVFRYTFRIIPRASLSSVSFGAATNPCLQSYIGLNEWQAYTSLKKKFLDIAGIKQLTISQFSKSVSSNMIGSSRIITSRESNVAILLVIISYKFSTKGPLMYVIS